MAGLFCRDCGQSLPAIFVPGMKESKILAASFCDACFRARSQHCQVCGGGLRAEDFEEGRAVALAGRRYCESCFEEKGRRHGNTDPALARRHARFLPCPESSMAILDGGLGGLFRRDRLKVWLDVSEGGFRAILEGRYGEGDALRGEIKSSKEKRAYRFVAEVRHVRPAPRHAGCALAGCAFIDPSIELTTFIRASTGGRPIRLPGARPA